jgi:protein SCO1/2
MKWLAAIACAFVAMAAPASAAGITSAALDTVSVVAPPNAALPLALRFTDERGEWRTLKDVIADRPAVLLFADYTCSNLCGPVLAFAAAGLENSGLTPGKDYGLVVIGLDPKDTRADAQAMKIATLGADGPLARASTFLRGDGDAVRAATQALGYHYTYDATRDQFAHPAAAFVLTAGGRVVRVLSGLGLSGNDLRLALTDAGAGKVGSVLDQIRLRCFGFDPVKGIYTASISRWLMLAAALTVLALAAGLAFMTLRFPRGARP